YEVNAGLDLSSVVQIYKISEEAGELALIFEDFGGQPLSIFHAEQDLTLTELLELSIQLSEAIHEIHSQNIIHKKIIPQSIFYNPINGEIKISDFSRATSIGHLSHEEPFTVFSRDYLAYLSPEHTGGMNRQINFQTDLYSLGAVLYEIFTGQLPFKSDNPKDLISMHMLKAPVEPHLINVNLPKTISDIIMKLLEKPCERRYQSALGLKTDLAHCLRDIQNGANRELRKLGQHDKVTGFSLSQSIYGRKEEIATLTNIINNLAHNNSCLTLVSGHPGTGKTLLVKEIQKPIIENMGYFIQGKFEQFCDDIPYSAIIKAFQGLVSQMLSDSEKNLNQNRKILLEALGNNAQIMIDVIPDLELIIGKQTPLAELSAADSQTRFNNVFQKFIRILSERYFPLVLFLDDMQWADIASIQLLSSILLMTDTRSFLIIGAYRENEVDDDHVLSQMIQKINLNYIKNKNGARVAHIFLKPFNIDNIKDLLSESLDLDAKTIDKLTVLIAEKTLGNPFYVKQYIQTLFEDELIWLESYKDGWQIDLKGIANTSNTENVLEFMTSRLRRLSSEAQTLLKLASCIGTIFEPADLAYIANTSSHRDIKLFRELLIAGVIVPTGEKYRFLHDRVRQAAYSLISPDEREIYHYNLGKQMLKDLNEEQIQSNIFELCNHLNIAKEQIISNHENILLAELNLRAAVKSKTTSAFDSMFHYSIHGIELLGSQPWDDSYKLCLALYNNAIESAYIVSKKDEMIRLSEILLDKVKSPLDQLKAYEINISYNTTESNLDEALNLSLTILKRLGMPLPHSPGQGKLLFQFLKTRWALRGKSPDNLKDLPLMSDPMILNAMRIMMMATSAFYMSKPKLVIYMALRIVELSIKYGLSSLSPFALHSYAVVLSSLFQKKELSQQYAQVSLELLNRPENQLEWPRLYCGYNLFLRHWHEPIKNTLPSLLEVYQKMIDQGNIEFISMSVFLYSLHLLFSGEKLQFVESETTKYHQIIHKYQSKLYIISNGLHMQIISILRGKTDNPLSLTGDYFNEEKELSVISRDSDHTRAARYYTFKMMISYLFGDDQQALLSAQKGIKYLDAVLSQVLVPVFYFYQSLSILANLSQTDRLKRWTMLRKVKSNQKKFRRWATW
ncbi:MAG: AAA family ATPase, partial [Spirochaetota bacterium]|nr:AAA family ATPase [Spirochaetota bacterium]